ncbi:RNA helicase [Brevundimonas sp. EAKA]|jgi:superfamily II DNA/RNA helicase|uniref:DEAD-box ATP-dependent RNA helicase RhpA n=1 Tax=Brevundimonas mediterranea TaxID=74329 RepID=A0AB37E9M9_9CAUL|nr:MULTISPECIES: DEAD/DEAH box helicase [Brevundimonas]OYX79353.1 MAG: RNA helicase [Brevundimonas sp. 32-68-21]EDX82167.1 DEAD/DEAH box helicase domain protein [Brevundimonas sp. BAL3]KDP95227.1 RNA helicase [Brevundimonas sp. EAKA]MBA4332747.1 ATP-dependent helicase [Brevundimonas sp.]QIH73959.1 DEAD/DEAH box helicase [Brevundimonas mediterranea]
MTEFSQLGLSPTTLQAVADTGYTTATPIQEQAIPVALAGRDVLGIAQTGTGKTAAFTLPLVERLASGRARARMPRAIVLAPTRELADQVAESFAKYAKGTKLTWVLLIGGVSMGDQVAALNKGVDVLIATPGRLLDLFERGKMLLTGVEIMVVDEADRMLDMGFIPDIERIFKLTPPRRQTLFFSATMPPEITRLTAAFLKDPTRIEASRPAMTADTITQYIVRIPTSDPKAKRAALRALMSRTDVRNGIVFCNRKSEVDIVAKSLKTHGFDAAAIHGDLDQSHRTKTLADFRSGALKILVASDVAARGLDIPDVSHVFNYDVSHHADDYVHRIGRTGRAGKLGQAFMIVTPADDKSLDKVLKLIKMDPQELVLDDIDFDAIKDGGRDDKRSSRSNETRSGGRGRSRAAEPAQAPAPAVALAETDAAEAPTRSRSRRKAKPEVSVETVVEPEMAPVVEKPAGRGRSRARSEPRPEAKIEPRIESRIEAEPAPSEEARAARTDREPQLRQSDRRGERRPEERERSGVKGFGDDIPAFLRRPVVIRA